jgi:hypothetical protein
VASARTQIAGASSIPQAMPYRVQRGPVTASKGCASSPVDFETPIWTLVWVNLSRIMQ